MTRTTGTGIGDSMRITSLGHAGVRVDGADVRLLMDPWLSELGAFQASWFQFPANDHLDRRALLDCDYVTVSHEHLDHMDLSVLGSLPPTTTVLIPRYPAPHFRNRLVAAGIRNVREVPGWQRFRLNEQGDWLTFIPEQSPMCHDSAVLVCVGGASLLHCNDARLTVGQARRATIDAGGTLDVLAVQMSSATWHPICYEYPDAQIAAIGAAKRMGKFRAVSRLVRLVEPKIAVPFAGPMCFLDPELSECNQWLKAPGLFPDQRQAADFLTDRLPGQRVGLWMPGDSYEPRSGRHIADDRWRSFDFSATDEYLDAYATARRDSVNVVRAGFPAPGSELKDAFVEHFRRLGELSPYFLERIDMTVRFELTGSVGGRWDVDLRPEGVRVDLKGRARHPEYRFRLDSRWLAPVIFGQIAWEDLFLSLRFSAWRDPDIYNDYLIGLLKHAEPGALASVEAYERGKVSDERTVVAAPGGRYEISRYCPHAGEDLAIGSVVADGVIRCLGHNLEFDLETGACVNARCDPLITRNLERNGSDTSDSHRSGGVLTSEDRGPAVSPRPDVEPGLELEPALGISPSRGRRSLDVAVALLVMGLALPLLPALLLAVRLSTGGSAIYRQRRVGQGGVPFDLYKFRTMRPGVAGPEVTARGDSRVTRLGAVLRRSSVDELPQMLNVLLGHMTLVGARPESVALARRYPAELRSVFRYRPGLTGPSQVLVRDEKVLPNVSDVEDFYVHELVPYRVATDLNFLEDATLASTVRWLAKTARYLIAVIAPRPASKAAVDIQPLARDWD